MVAGRLSVIIKKDLDGYGAKAETNLEIFLRITFSGGGKHCFLQDSAHICKFCSVYQILLTQNCRILVGLNLGLTLFGLLMT